MTRLPGIIKVTSVLILDFFILLGLFGNIFIALIISGIVILYVWLGGYISLFREGAVKCNQLSSYERTRLNTAKIQLTEDVKLTSSADISGMKFYLVPGDDDMNATAYGRNCISITRGAFTNADPLTLNAVLAHEISHIINFDPEFNRAVFCSVTLLVGAISVMSVVTMAVIFLLFLFLNCFHSWLGVMAFNGISKAVGGSFSFIQRGIVVIYRSLLSLASRHAEYRCDLYSCNLGYGLQLAHFLAIAAPESHRQLTMTEALYRSHPSTEKRIARLEEHMNQKNIVKS